MRYRKHGIALRRENQGGGYPGLFLSQRTTSASAFAEDIAAINRMNLPSRLCCYIFNAALEH
jgi:hypothetical protein